jgi:hypothetical protein
MQALVRLVFWAGGIFMGFRRSWPTPIRRSGGRDRLPFYEIAPDLSIADRALLNMAFPPNNHLSGSADSLSVIAIITMIAITWMTVKQFSVAVNHFRYNTVAALSRVGESRRHTPIEQSATSAF